MTKEELIEGLTIGAKLRGHEEEMGKAMARYIAQTPRGREALSTLQFKIFWSNLTTGMKHGRRRPAKQRAP